MKLQVTIDGHTYAVDVEVLEDEESLETPPHAPLHADKAPAGHARPHAGGAWDVEGKVCRSPVMGLVIKVNVTPGQNIEAGELMMALEAMKMETHITAPRPGTVKSVHVAQGDSVKVDQALIEFE